MQTSPRLSLRIAAVVASIACFAPLQAFATLGGDEASIEADRVAMNGTAGTPLAGAGYIGKRYTLPSGTVVREFLSASGVVFGVAWEGPLMPDMKRLLGESHFQAMGESMRVRNREGQRGPLLIPPKSSSSLVIESGGHMRAFAGRAYLADQLPSGVDANEVR